MAALPKSPSETQTATELQKEDESHLKLGLKKNFSFSRQVLLREAFDIASFNHMSREVSDVQKSVYFYVNILGFQPIPRPEFDVEGEWLWGHGLNFHIVKTSNPEARQILRTRRIKYFHDNLPSVDHIAFIAKDISVVKRLLQEENVYFREFNYEKTGIHQLFFFDPDGNAIEVSNCAPPIGETRCSLKSSEMVDLCYLEANGYF
mmetsp:Transcript_8719/g.14813  ORF Transcript_8719/g.14813 Transcript_8719/m.14813 type:complete len:205 (+) Transcript_8719:98-712(+)|eukprot:CAMPEP_0114431746 /NCGR_PEP_ID=MMETSP0103-20121206/10774_1 /TAXON_ID=37642 ORGANISM="Paraphysomonas imperforata, Strain PA2" /NCGR_SAMPLE_ID=MMETSP0103 /ASSEMBLY_ACC=CAM_ASM_000201 /LENGTH=204 /DNA_ID=CAMNT_0001601351 /DNA_START=30 /DNA_END=644 /DNA_ORIENTATION=+